MGQTLLVPMPVFGGVPSAATPTGALTGVSLFKSGIATPPRFTPLLVGKGLAFTTSAPAAASTPKPSRSSAWLPVSILLTSHPGRRTGFLTDPIQVGFHTLAGSIVGLGKEGKAALDQELRGMAGDVAHEHGIQPGEKHPVDDEEEEEDNEDDGNGSTFEDARRPGRPRAMPNRPLLPTGGPPLTLTPHAKTGTT